MLFLIILTGIAIGLFFYFKNEHNNTKELTFESEKNKTNSTETKEQEALGYRRHRYILTKAEISFYGVLKTATKEKYEILLKVRIADVLKPKIANRSEWQTAFNKIAHKHFDFLICKKETLEIVAAIELNDKSHEISKRNQRDDFIKEACKSASLPLICIQASNGYNIEKTRQIIESIIKPN